ncbi:hypothetical protein NXF25_019074 [Crotalus adamanteus]|uniref:Gypsy retrotransposon integrase-like protein 1 n=1 Tax=Crotalus adamanteus TaxID=8729 RepID=A0AAW1B0T4_CROAD
MVRTLQGALLSDPWLMSHPHILTMRDGLAWKGEKVYVPQSLRVEVLRRGHDVKSAGHFGFLKTLHLLKRQFWWPGMKTDVEKYVRECSMCATTKPRIGKPSGLLQQVSDPNRLWKEIGMDFIVDLPASHGNTVISTVIDLFSKQAHVIPCKGLPSARQLTKLFITHIYRLHGVPHHIISDRGVQFTTRFWRNFITSISSSQGLSSTFHPSTNGAAERANAMAERYLRCYINYQQTNWADLLPFAEVAYNNTIHSSTGFTPFRVVHGIEFAPIPECPQGDPGSQQPHDWVLQIKSVWKSVKKGITESGTVI